MRIARWSANHPWSAIGLWTAFVVLCLFLGGAAGTNKISDDESGVRESGRAGKIVADGDFGEQPEESVLITAKEGGKLQVKAARAAATDVQRRMKSLDGVASVGAPVASDDGLAMLVPVVMKGDAENADQRIQPLLDQSAAAEQAHPGLRVEQVGTGSTAKGLTETLGKDFQKAEFISLPMTLLILLVVFGALIAAGVPVVLALSAVGAAMGLSSLASHLLPATSAISNVILLMGMAVGVDYSLFYLKREREERQKGKSHHDAIEIAAETSGHTVVVSGITVMVSMAGLYLANEATFASLATGSIIVVAVAVIASLTVLPALLAKLGRWVDRPKIPFLWRLTMRSGESRVWPALLRPALGRPALTLVLSVVVLLLAALPALDMKLKQPGSDDLSRDIPVVRAMDRLTHSFPSKGTVHQVAVRASADQAGEVKSALRDLARRVEKDKLFAHDQEPKLRESADHRVHTLDIGTPYTPKSDGARASLDTLRSWVPAAFDEVPGAEHGVTGKVAQSVDFTAHLEERLPYVIGFVLLLTLVMMAGIFRSAAIALSAIGLNLLSAAASFGVLVAVFQHTWAEKLLDFQSSGAVVSWLPLFLFVVLFGLSMDYHVFVVSRIREAAESGMSTKDAVRDGIVKSAGVVTSAAVVMVGVFSIFGTLSMVEFKQLGVGLAVAILIDAVVIRIFVLPALMTVLGDRNWWPGGLRSRGRSTAVPAHAGRTTATARQPVAAGTASYPGQASHAPRTDHTGYARRRADTHQDPYVPQQAQQQYAPPYTPEQQAYYTDHPDHSGYTEQHHRHQAPYQAPQQPYQQQPGPYWPQQPAQHDPRNQPYGDRPGPEY
ncbi:MMPL family transporter [Streptomyces sp. NRRL B-1347]|uniref:MMPL family transporter n=1 Tax=Streptomyces sp. NRRL B-1347 TaxID=1476877 RepID=UPI000B0A9F95|nr:MMPL family transporter [Streptomyces sp. NRRL B-1347]